MPVRPIARNLKSQSGHSKSDTERSMKLYCKAWIKIRTISKLEYSRKQVAEDKISYPSNGKTFEVDMESSYPPRRLREAFYVIFKTSQKTT